MGGQQPVQRRAKLTLKTSRLGPAMAGHYEGGTGVKPCYQFFGVEGKAAFVVCARCIMLEQCRLHGTVLAHFWGWGCWSQIIDHVLCNT